MGANSHPHIGRASVVMELPCQNPPASCHIMQRAQPTPLFGLFIWEQGGTKSCVSSHNYEDIMSKYRSLFLQYYVTQLYYPTFGLLFLHCLFKVLHLLVTISPYLTKLTNIQHTRPFLPSWKILVLSFLSSHALLFLFLCLFKHVMKVYLIYYKNHLFQVSNSMLFSNLTKGCNNHHKSVLEHLHPPANEIPQTHLQGVPLSPPGPFFLALPPRLLPHSFAGSFSSHESLNISISQVYCVGPLLFSPCALPLENLILTMASVTTQKQIALDLPICSKSEHPKDLLDTSIIEVERVFKLHISKAKLMASVLVLVLNLSKQNNYQFNLQSQKSQHHPGAPSLTIPTFT